MAKTSENPIGSMAEDWGHDERNGLPYSGSAVQRFIKEQLSAAIMSSDLKVGSAALDGGTLRFYDADGGRELFAVNLTGTSYIIDLHADREQNFYVLTSQSEAPLTIQPMTVTTQLGSTDREDFEEGYTFRVDIDNGGGYVDRTPSDNHISAGGSASIDIRRHLTIGVNRLRLSVTGTESGQTKTTVFTVNLTSLSLTVRHPWHRAWIQGEPYSIDGIQFSGNIAKTLHVKVGGDHYRMNFLASVQYTSAPYSFILTDNFPTEGTGVYDVEVWMDGGGVETPHYNYHIMCVSAAETASARLVCINEAATVVRNYMSQTIFRYATYNLTGLDLDVTATLGDETRSLVDLHLDVQTQTPYDYTTTLELDTELTSGLALNVALSGGGQTASAAMPIDNSGAFTATEGATFYLNPKIRENNSADREEIHNTAPGTSDASLPARWSDFTFKDDAWTTDTDSHKCLAVMAGSTLAIEGLKPLDASGHKSVTVEWMYRVSNISDYDTPIFSIMSTEEFVQSATRGIVLFPTRLLVYDSISRDSVLQKIDLPEGRIVHVAVVLQKNYHIPAGNRNLCRVYINGRENLAYEYGSTSLHTDTGGGYGYVRMGQDSADFHLYMMRCYDKALEAPDVVRNYINALIADSEVSKEGERSDNDISDGGVVSYSKCKKAGFNCMVIESRNEIPSFHNQNEKGPVNLRLEYNDHPEWNVNIYGIPIAGQGTTSMNYAKWNLTHKIKNAVEWEYPNIDGGKTEHSVDGYLAGYGRYPKVSKITSKKNIASSPQGHKMGATAMYNDLFARCCETEMLPSAGCRTATYQYPFLGFRKFGDGDNDYRFIGLYTVGPDKKDPKTFGYDKTGDYPSLMMIEGPSHAPLMTRFLVPWTDDVHYDSAQETLALGSGGNTQEGWDADIVSNLKTDNAGDADAIFSLYVSEFKPAYDAIYFCSPYIASLEEAFQDNPGFGSLEDVNANVSAFRNGRTRGHKNELMSFYDGEYSLIYYDFASGRYKRLPEHDMLGYLGLSGTPTTDDILAAREAKFKDEQSGVFRYVNKEEALFHECFCELLGVSDNHAKNTYWRKFSSIANGGKWGFNQDDLDTIFQNDNNGQDTKSYSVEPDDTNLTGAEIFQGTNSAFWRQLRLCCRDELRNMMRKIVEGIQNIAVDNSRNDTTSIFQTVVNVIGLYFWENSSKYFPATAYNEDTKFGYIDVWGANPDGNYNDVPPLTQIHGDHYNTELAWVERRIAYVFSKYKLGDWDEEKTDSFGRIQFTLHDNFDMAVTPAIDLYPAYSVGKQAVVGSARVKAGTTHLFRMEGNDNTNIYVKGVDWLSDLGDLSGMVLASRGGDSSIQFAVSGKRLRRLKVGSDGSPAFNAKTLQVDDCPCMERVDARNVAVLDGSVDLRKCPRLREADFSGTNVSVVFPPVGGRVKDLRLPASVTTLFLHSLNLLRRERLDIPDEAFDGIESLYVNGCTLIDPIELLMKIMLDGDGNVKTNRLANLTVIWDGVRELPSPTALDAIAALVENAYDSATGRGIGSLSYENGSLTTNGSAPNLQGSLRIPFPVYADSVAAILSKLPTLTMTYDESQLYFRFADEEVLRVMASAYGDGTGTLVSTIEGITLFGQAFHSNTAVEDLRDLARFPNLTGIVADAFRGCTNLGSITFPASLQTIDNNAFNGCLNLREITFPDSLLTIGPSAFTSCSGLQRLYIPASVTQIGSNAFSGLNGASVTITVADASAWCNIGFGGPDACPAVNDTCKVVVEGVETDGEITLENIVSIPTKGFVQLECRKVTISSGAERIGSSAFRGSSIQEIVIPGTVTSIGGNAFSGSGLRELTIPDSVTTIEGNGICQSCVSLESVTIGSGIGSLPNFSFTGCNALRSVTVRAATPPSFGNQALPSNVTAIYVPNGRVGDYESASGWNAFSGKFREISTMTND